MATANKTYVKHDFSKENLSSMHFENCNFYECNFNRSDLTDAKFIECRFIEQGGINGSTFDYTNLRDVSFKHCQLSMASFISANCLGAEFRSCDLKGLILLKHVLKIKYPIFLTFAPFTSQVVIYLMPILPAPALKNVIYLKTNRLEQIYKVPR